MPVAIGTAEDDDTYAFITLSPSSLLRVNSTKSLGVAFQIPRPDRIGTQNDILVAMRFMMSYRQRLVIA